MNIGHVGRSKGTPRCGAPRDPNLGTRLACGDQRGDGPRRESRGRVLPEEAKTLPAPRTQRWAGRNEFPSWDGGVENHLWF